MSVPASPKRKRLLCRFNVHHKWVRRKNPEGEDYQQCKACGKDLYDVERHDPDIIGGFGGPDAMPVGDRDAVRAWASGRSAQPGGR
jgi:hypothetical protein